MLLLLMLVAKQACQLRPAMRLTISSSTGSAWLVTWPQHLLPVPSLLVTQWRLAAAGYVPDLQLVNTWAPASRSRGTGKRMTFMHPSGTSSTSQAACIACLLLLLRRVPYLQEAQQTLPAQKRVVGCVRRPACATWDRPAQQQQERSQAHRQTHKQQLWVGN